MVTQLQNKVIELETKLSNFKSDNLGGSAEVINNDAMHLENTSSPASKKHANQLTALVTSFISGRKGKG